MVRVVFDTVVFVRCLINPTGLWGRLVFDRAADYALVLSLPILAEVLEVLQRPDLTRKYRGLAGRDVQAILSLVATAERVELIDIPRVSRDPNDDKFLATAKAAGADYLVTEDQDLLVLGRHEDVRIVTAATFLRALEY